MTMTADDFFTTNITDNKYEGCQLNSINELNKDFYCNTNGKHNKTEVRKKAISDFVNEINRKFSTKLLHELDITPFTFDDEFEANTKQQIFSIRGSTFDDLKIYTGNIVGSIIYKSQIFNINCRFGNDFLQYMIANSSGFLELENLGAIDKNLGLGEWVMIYYWKLQLKKAFSLGLYKTYQKKKENLSTIRGNIDINAVLRKNYFDGKTVCNFKQHSFNNELNAVITMALSKVFKSKYQSIVTDTYQIKSAFDSISTSKINLNHIKNHKVINPYFKKYNQVFDLSLKILKDEFANVGESKSDFSAFLFDISLLFEHHVRKVLKQRLTLFPKNKKEFYIPNGISTNSIYPDVIVDFGNNEIGIYDVKYKNFNFQDGVSREDKFQLVSYVAMHLSQYKVIECGIIYPLREDDINSKAKIKQQCLRVGKEEIPFIVRFYTVYKSVNDQKLSDEDFLRKFMSSKLTVCDTSFTT